MNIYVEFENYLKKECGIHKQDTLLLGVSGGIDSMVLFHLLRQYQVNFHIAHCNFQLRGSESDKDEVFVKETTKKYKTPLFAKRFETAKHAKDKGISIQMAARELRLQWFNELVEQNQYSYICLAHHLDDQIETIFINLLRGTGIRGLRAMLPNNGKIVRPLLFLNRKQIAKYAKEHDIEFREDSSNLTDEYIRNQIRHNIIPILHEQFPQLYDVMFDNQKKFANTISLFDEFIEKTKNDIKSVCNDIISFDLGKLHKHQHLTELIFELISQYNFNYSQAHAISNNLKQTQTTQYTSSTHEIFLKNSIIEIIATNQQHEEIQYLIEKEADLAALPIKINYELIANSETLELKTSNNTALLDYETVKFPLIVRKWKKGDEFIPFGMNQKKLLSDFFINLKLTQSQKNNIWLLCEQNEIIWLIGYRINNKYRVTPKTLKVLKLTLD